MTKTTIPLDVIEVTSNLVIDYQAKEWCKLPYPGHPQGCPNYGKIKKPPKDPYEIDECPPHAGKIEDIFDLEKRHWFVILKFDLLEHVVKLLIKWIDEGKTPTEKQARCVLYWQSAVRNRLRAECNKIRLFYSDAYFTLIPEAFGVNVIRTALRLGVPISTKPVDTVYKIALVGFPKNEKEKNPILQQGHLENYL